MSPWSLRERAFSLARAERDGVDLLVVGGGITGAGILRDASSRGLRALLVEQNDFASGTSSGSSKMIHGGLRYLAVGQPALTRESCRERDLLLRLNPNLVRPLPFLLPAYDDAMPLWQVRTALLAYSALANFRRTTRWRMLPVEECLGLCPELRREGLRGAGLYHDAAVDDARLVLANLQNAMEWGATAISHAEVVEFESGADGRLVGARVRDHLGGHTLTVRAHSVVNAAGAAVERIRGLDRPVDRPELRPAKGIHLVIPRERLQCDAAVTFDACDGRHLFITPWGDVSLLGTTDTFSNEIDRPVVTIEEVHYVLEAANRAFPGVALTTNDLCSVFAAVRPLVASPGEDRPATDVSREHRIYEDPSGLLSVAGGKLTTHRAIAESLVDRVLQLLPESRRAAAGPSRTETEPLRCDDFDAVELEAELGSRFGVSAASAEHLVCQYGVASRELLAGAAPDQRVPIGRSRFLLAEIPWAIQHECAATLSDVLERRVRLAISAVGQGLPELAQLARAAAAAAGWDEEQTRAEASRYAATVRGRYQIVAPTASGLEQAA